MPRFTLIIAAAGRSRRFGSATEKKPFVIVHGKPVWQHAVEAFAHRREVAEILMAVAPEDREYVETKFGPNLIFANVRLVDGGEERSDSVLRALQAMGGESDFVAVHDAARPCVEREAIDRVFAAAVKEGAAILASPVTATLKRVDAEKRIVETVDRSGLWMAQTPQVFRRDWLVEAYAARRGQPTDEAQAVEACGYPVTIVEGAATNLKITTADDLTLAKNWLKGRSGGDALGLFGN